MYEQCLTLMPVGQTQSETSKWLMIWKFCLMLCHLKSYEQLSFSIFMISLQRELHLKYLINAFIRNHLMFFWLPDTVIHGLLPEYLDLIMVNEQILHFMIFVYTETNWYSWCTTSYLDSWVTRWTDEFDSEPTDHNWVVADQSCNPVSWNVKLQTIVSPVMYIL